MAGVGRSMYNAVGGSAITQGWQGLTAGLGGQWGRATNAFGATGFGNAVNQRLQAFSAAGGWAGQWNWTRDAFNASRIGGAINYGATWTKANALPVGAGAAAVGLLAVQGYQRQLELNEEGKALSARVAGSSLSDAEKRRYNAPSSQAKIGNIMGTAGAQLLSLGGVAALTGVGAVPAAIMMGLGGAMTIGGSWLQGDAATKRRKDMESMDVIDSYEREKKLADSVNGDLRSEGDTAKLAQMMGKQISGTDWDRTLDLERQTTLLRQGGSYSVFRKGGKSDKDKFGWGTDQSGGWLSLGTEAMDLRRRVSLGGKLSDDDKLSMVRLFSTGEMPTHMTEGDESDGITMRQTKADAALQADVETLRSGGTLSESSRKNILDNYSRFNIEGNYKKRTKKEFGDITKEMGVGLSQFQSGFGEVLTNSDVTKLGGGGVSSDDIAKLVSSRSSSGGLTDAYKAARDTMIQKAGTAGVVLDSGKIDQFTDSLYKMSKGLVDASGGTKTMADATKQTSAASIKAAQDLKDQNRSRMIELMPRLGSMSSSHFVSTGGGGDRYFGVNKNTEALLGEATTMDMSKYSSDPAGFVARMKAVGANINEYVTERDTKISQTGGLISSFQDSGGRFKSDWETEGEYQFKKQSLQAQARLGRTGAAEQLQMNEDLGAYLTTINDPSALIENIRQFSEAGFSIDPEVRKKALAGMMAQGLTRNMKKGTGIMDDVRDKAHADFGKETGLSDQYFMPEEYIDLDTARTALPGFGKELKSIRLTGIDAPEITSDEKKKVGDLTRQYLKDKDTGSLMKGLDDMKRPLAEEIASALSAGPGEGRDKLVSQLMTPEGLQEFAKSTAAVSLPMDQRGKLTSLYHHTGMQRMFEMQNEYGVDAAYQISGEMDVYGRMLDQKGGKVKPVYRDRTSGELRDDIDLKKQLIDEGWLEGTTPTGSLYSALPDGLLSDKSGRERTPLEAASWRKWNAAIRYKPEALERGFVTGTSADSWSVSDTGGFNTGMMTRGLSSAYEGLSLDYDKRAKVEDDARKQGLDMGYYMSSQPGWDGGDRDVFAQNLAESTARSKLGEYDAAQALNAGPSQGQLLYEAESGRFTRGLADGKSYDGWSDAQEAFVAGAGLGDIGSGLGPDLTAEWDVRPVEFGDRTPSAYDTQKSLFVDAVETGGAAPTGWDMALAQADLGAFEQVATPKTNLDKYWGARGESIRYDDISGTWTNEKSPALVDPGAITEPTVGDDRLADAASGTTTAMQSLMDTCMTLNDAMNETAARLAAIG